MQVVNVNNLGPALLDILREKQERRTYTGSTVRILAADAGELLTHLKSVIYTEWLQKTSFEFAIVDPAFGAIDEGNPRSRNTVQGSLERIAEFASDPTLATRAIQRLSLSQTNARPGA